jgi:L-aminopeptidase/D-esterase-like protein
VAAVDVRGSAPGTRETALLQPQNLVDRVQAIVFAGGSVYGLAAADGVVRWLAERGLGFPVGSDLVAPIVPAAVLFDLGRGKNPIPDINGAWGRDACGSASEGLFDLGTVGAGTGALAGGIKGGVGTASLRIEQDFLVAALAVVNAWGSAVDPSTGRFWEIGREVDGEFAPDGHRSVRLPQPTRGAPMENTTLAVVAVNADLSAAQALKVAQMAHNGLARAVRPSHTMLDGDTVFCLALGRQRLSEKREEAVLEINALGEAAADCLSRSIIRAVLGASSLGGMTAFRDLPSRD